MTENARMTIDELFAKIRLQVLKVRETDPSAAEELKSLLTQLEDWIESLVIDSLKLKSLEHGAKTVTKSQHDAGKTNKR